MRTNLLTKAQCAGLELLLIPASMREEESALMQTRWFDYRNLLPVQATELFAQTYDEVYREVYAMTRDYRKADDLAPVTGKNLFRGSDLLPLWRARQEADRIGCKYPFYLRKAFKRVWDRGWRYMPRPNQLYGEEIVSDMKDEWLIETGGSLQEATSPRFKPDAFIGAPDQVAYHEYLIAQVKRREHQHLSLSRLVFKEKVLPVELASKHFTAEVLRRAQVAAGQ